MSHMPDSYGPIIRYKPRKAGQINPTRKTYAAFVAIKDVGCQSALVRLVKDDHAVALQQRIRHGLAQEHAVRTEPEYSGAAASSISQLRSKRTETGRPCGLLNDAENERCGTFHEFCQIVRIINHLY
eukprot:scaffold301723_cov28-Prasinocladus_malaysianus.AAC.2